MVTKEVDFRGVEIVNLSLHVWTLRMPIPKVHTHQQWQCYTWDYLSRYWYIIDLCGGMQGPGPKETLLITWTSAYVVRTTGLLA